jgi:EmrB/QacA subfamily drug resistance transporter
MGNDTTRARKESAGPNASMPVSQLAMAATVEADVATSWTSAQRWVVGITGVAAAMVGLDALVVSTALGTIRVDLGASVEELEWTVNAYTLSFAVLMMTASALGDRYGRRAVFVTGVGLFGAASATCALAPSVGWLIAGRAVQGAGAAAVMPLTLALLTSAIPPHQRPKALGIYATLTAASVPLGPLLGGAVVQGVSWPWIFWLNVPFAAVLIPLAWTRIEESFGHDTVLDVPGVVLVTGATCGLVWGLVRGNAAGWGSFEVLVALTAGVLLAAAFVFFERRTVHPMLPMRLFGSRSFSGGTAAMFFLWGSTLGALFFMAQFLQTGLGYGPLATGVRLVPWGGVVMIVPRFVGAYIPRLGERPFIAAGMALHATALAWVALIAEPGMDYWKMLAPLLLSGLGVAMASPATQSSVLSAAAARDIGRSTGTFSTLRQLGGAFGVAVYVAVFAGAGGYASAADFVDGFAPALGAGAGLAVAALCAGLTVPRRSLETVPSASVSASSPIGAEA